jgi:DNA-binding NarL/FixJ family response regulator
LSRDPTAISVLLVTPPGATEEALRAALASIAGVELVGVAAGCLSAVNAIGRLAPSLVLISGQVPDKEIVALIEQLADEHQAARTVVLSSSPSLGQQSLAAGAFAVLATWEPVDRLRAVIQRGVMLPAAAEVSGHGICS